MQEIEKIKNVIIFVEKNYNRQISPAELENVSNYSYRNIQRIFKNIFKENIGEYQKRIRLENGFKRLIYSNETISDISFSIGYESNQAFTKAFNKNYSITPRKARENKELIFNDFIANIDSKYVKSEIVKLNSIEVYYDLIITNDYDNSTINKLWDKIYENANYNCQIDYYGVIVDQPLLSIKSKCRYEACFTKSETNIKKAKTKLIDGGKYIKYTHFGSYDTILDTYRFIYNDWLFLQKYEIDAKPIIEHYHTGSINVIDEEKYITHILIPIK
ncbi:AraC family transcriptional regulator [Flavobacterium amnicola]|uniref:AraC family transcriptional regulator n=1 Tax=Flavobacterium amnicola TaxID=2506422 RepID=A0A4Q1K3L8_9FLAO|nr:AraC family transcriptional regulator [Flavobacterium amnicola]RXR19389.1 AraC family transcriptional regulator [Flavobacterium amnicola]